MEGGRERGEDRKGGRERGRGEREGEGEREGGGVREEKGSGIGKAVIILSAWREISARDHQPRTEQ